MKKVLFATLLGLFIAPTASYANFDKDLRLGSRGIEVKAMQEFLTKYACYDGPVTGFFFLKTRAAVQCFQARHELPAFGFWGPKTRHTANEILKITGEYIITPVVKTDPVASTTIPAVGGNAGSSAAAVGSAESPQSVEERLNALLTAPVPPPPPIIRRSRSSGGGVVGSTGLLGL